MNCSKRIFVLEEKHDTRYIVAKDREATAMAIVKQRIEDGYWYTTEETDEFKNTLSVKGYKDPAFKWLSSRNGYEYEGFKEAYLEILTDEDECDHDDG